MKIGVDFHGVITQNPIFFKSFNQLALEQNIEIVILSGAKASDVIQFLKKHHIPYTSVWSILDEFERKNLVSFDDSGKFRVPDELWDKAKAQYCLEHNISVHIDDSALYGSYFQTPFCLYLPENQKCTLIKKNIQIDFAQKPQKILNDLIAAINLK